MYNFEGLRYQLTYAPTTILFIPFFIMFIIVIRKRDKKNILIFLFGVLLFIYSSFINVNSILNPDIKSYEGTFLNEYSQHASYHAPFIWRYVFKNGDKSKGFYYPAHLLPVEFEKGKEYIIYYEDTNDIIVKIELIE